MALIVGTEAGEYPPIVHHVADGEPAESTVLNRPTLELDARTEALKNAVEELDTVNSAVIVQVTNNTDAIADQALVDAALAASIQAHTNTSSMHTTFATAEETKETSEVLVVSPLELNTLIKNYLHNYYTYIVGPTTILGTTHTTLIAALAVANPGDKILVTQGQTVDAAIVIAVSNIEIECRRGVTFQAGASADCFIITVDDVYLSKATISGFSGTGISVGSGINRTMLRDTRYIGCTTPKSDSGNNTTEFGHTID